jgi:Rrf2 family protein
VRVSAKADYAVRAALELATQPRDTPVKGDQIAVNQDIPARFVDNILFELRQADIVESKRGTEGGYCLAQDPAHVTIAQVIQAVEGPVAAVRGHRPDEVSYSGSAKSLQDVWLALRANTRLVLESVTLADVADGLLPEPVLALASHPEATADRSTEP